MYCGTFWPYPPTPLHTHFPFGQNQLADLQRLREADALGETALFAKRSFDAQPVNPLPSGQGFSFGSTRQAMLPSVDSASGLTGEFGGQAVGGMCA